MSDDKMRRMEARLDALENRVQTMEAIDAVKNLQHAYAFYIDKGQYEQTVELFAEDGEVRFLNGVWKGHEGISRLYCDWFRNYFLEGRNWPNFGLILEHMASMDIVHISDDGLSAKARWRCLLFGAHHESATYEIPGLPDAFWEHGIYENQYVKENGVWKIKVHDYFMEWQANYDEGPAKSGVHLPLFDDDKTYPNDPNGPDQIIDRLPKLWPETTVVPFHYKHPVTGKAWTPSQG